jgi:hypothetical protein
MRRSSTTAAPRASSVWGLDLVGPLQKAPGGYTHLLVAVDKFSKWIEVRPLNSIRSEQVVAFFTNIIHRFGAPNSIITDNGTQFTESVTGPHGRVKVRVSGKADRAE